VVAALVVGLGARKGIDAIVFRVPAVPLDPMPLDSVRRRRFDQRRHHRL
jgi:hypothetical protein